MQPCGLRAVSSGANLKHIEAVAVFLSDPTKTQLHKIGSESLPGPTIDPVTAKCANSATAARSNRSAPVLNQTTNKSKILKRPDRRWQIPAN